MADKKPMPAHVAVIMDGNGRWAELNKVTKLQGHNQGMWAMKEIIKKSDVMGIKYLTVYAFSTENWKRSQEEVSGIMLLLERYLKEALEDMEKNRVSFHFFGDLSRLSPKLRKLCEDTQRRSSEYHEVRVNFCLNYGGRDEIIRAAQAFAADVAAGKRTADSLTEFDFANYLDSAGVPDPELVIRPSGEMRTSNFLPWQTAYSEFVFMDVLWPDFGPKDLDAAIEEYYRRNRRFGGA